MLSSKLALGRKRPVSFAFASSPPRQPASSTSSSDSTSPCAPEANLGTGGQDDGPTLVKRRKSDDGGGRKRIRAVIRSMLQYGDRGNSGSIKGSREDARKSGFNLNSGSSHFRQAMIRSSVSSSIGDNSLSECNSPTTPAEFDLTSSFMSLNVAEDVQLKISTTASHLSAGRKKFNLDPKKGIGYLVEHGLLSHTSEEVAQFLYKGEGLRKTAIGDYLGERCDFNIETLKAFVSLHEFSETILVQALRQFLWSFRLPGEAQKIDRIMECFAERYCQLNPGVFISTDVCYVLSFSVIMLNTSLHNPNVKNKLSPEAFLSMNRGINHGCELPRELLLSLYNSIKKEPLKIPEEEHREDLMYTFFNPVKEGWLFKRGGRYKSWKRRWFILNDSCLYYFQFTTDKEPKGIIPLENIGVRDVFDRQKPCCFELFSDNTKIVKACKTDSDGRLVQGRHLVYRISASSEEERNCWTSSIRQSINDNPLQRYLSSRRQRAQKQNSLTSLLNNKMTS